MLLSMPYQGLGNAAISGVATDEQLQRLGRVWAAMAITEPGFGSDSAAVSTTAKLDGDEYVINGEKIFVTAGSRPPTSWCGRRWTSQRADRRSSRSSFRANTPVSPSSDWRTSSGSRAPTPPSSGSTTPASRKTTAGQPRNRGAEKGFAGVIRKPPRSAWGGPPRPSQIPAQRPALARKWKCSRRSRTSLAMLMFGTISRPAVAEVGSRFGDWAPLFCERA